MKRQPVRFLISKATSFTLVELLVVIGIIAILASVVLAGANQVILKAKRTKAATIASSIQTGVIGYYTEYSVYPIPTDLVKTTAADVSITDAVGSAGDWAALLWGLCGNINTFNPSSTTAPSGAVSNTRGIAFLTMKKSDVDANDGPLNPLGTTANPYFNIAIDGDYDGILGVGNSAITTIPNLTQGSTNSGGSSTSGVAIWANCNTAGGTNAAFWVYTY